MEQLGSHLWSQQLQIRGSLVRMNSLGSVTLLKVDFFNRDPRRVARSLLGKLLVRKTASGILAGRIVETEAYLGQNDAAAHAAAGKTARNSVLFGPPGRAYVYFIYGNHYCLNVSCLPDGVPGGVLFRALEPVAGIKQMAKARGIPLPDKAPDNTEKEPGFRKISILKKISSGPGRMSEALEITRERDNGKNLVSARSDLRLVDDGYRVQRVMVTPRIGIVKSADQPLRYFIAGNPFVSGRGS
ncbi:MAG: DNA-3-methyladenine glycosylase [Terriglobales bacterium]